MRFESCSFQVSKHFKATTRTSSPSPLRLINVPKSNRSAISGTFDRKDDLSLSPPSPQFLLVAGPLAMPEGEEVAPARLYGTIRGRIDNSRALQSYRSCSSSLISCMPREGARRASSEKLTELAPASRENDLISEIELLREQIGSIMCQVERAIWRLSSA